MIPRTWGSVSKEFNYEIELPSHLPKTENFYHCSSSSDNKVLWDKLDLHQLQLLGIRIKHVKLPRADYQLLAAHQETFQ